MIHAYDKNYLENARTSLGVMIDYAVNDCQVSLTEFWSKFIHSKLSSLFESGDSSTIVGKSGIELAQELLNTTITPTFNDARSPEYWLGWAISYYQWYRNISFRNISVPIEDVLELYNPYHEMDIMQFCDMMDELLGKNTKISNLKRIRQEVGISQSKLALLTGIPIRTIQQYEQKQKDINGARSEYLILLANALMCNPKDLLE